jgi:hypothetical protein
MPLKVIHLKTFEQFRDTVESDTFASSAFRGQANAEWQLFSSLSRYLQTYGVHPRAWPLQEQRILRIFQRKAHLMLPRLPDPDDAIEWLAIMQHHGAPTRLLDFTWSPFVAAFYALERATEHAAVWALFPPALGANARGQEPFSVHAFEQDFLPNSRRSVWLGEPHRMNQRMIAQSGTFVIPGILDAPIEALVPDHAIVKLVLDQGMRKAAMAKLYSMNVGNAALFPGLDGLARSLAYELEFHWAFDPTNLKARPGFSLDEVPGLPLRETADARLGRSSKGPTKRSKVAPSAKSPAVKPRKA